MPNNLVNGDECKWAFGSTPSVLTILPKGKFACQQLVGTMLDNIPLANIFPFGTCSAPTNPVVIAAFGSPVPYIPVTVTPWTMASKKIIANNVPVITKSSKLLCLYAGVISVSHCTQNKIESL